MSLNGRFRALNTQVLNGRSLKILIGIVVALVSAWASWSTTAIMRASEQRARIREHVQANTTNNKNIQHQLDNIQRTLDKLLDLEMHRANAQ